MFKSCKVINYGYGLVVVTHNYNAIKFLEYGYSLVNLTHISLCQLFGISKEGKNYNYSLKCI